MKVLKTTLIIVTVITTGYFGINQSFGEIGGPGQNACHHNGEFYALAPNATSCPDPGGHHEDNI